MARVFVEASSQYLEVATTPVTAAPLTMACWCRPSTVTAQTAVLVSICDSASDTEYFAIYQYDAEIWYDVRDAAIGLAEAGPGGTALTANTWVHAAAVEVANNSRIAYSGGVASATDSATRTPLSIDRIGVGRLSRLNATQYFDGRLCEVGIWNAALTAAEIAALAGGALPPTIRRDSLVLYAPVWGEDSPEPDLTAGSYDLTVTGATLAAHAPVAPVYFPPSWATVGAPAVLYPPDGRLFPKPKLRTVMA